MLALGLRETGLQNVNGGAILLNGEWVLPDPQHRDDGVFQISRDHHPLFLKRMVAVEEGTWGPVIDGFTAYSAGYCPRFEDSLQFTVTMMHEAQAYADDHGVPQLELGRFAVAAHNAGVWGAIKGWREGDVDKYTTYGDYSEWVMFHRTAINLWLKDHPGWRVT